MPSVVAALAHERDGDRQRDQQHHPGLAGPQLGDQPPVRNGQPP